MRHFQEHEALARICPSFKSSPCQNYKLEMRKEEYDAIVRAFQFPRASQFSCTLRTARQNLTPCRITTRGGGNVPAICVWPLSWW